MDWFSKFNKIYNYYIDYICKTKFNEDIKSIEPIRLLNAISQDATFRQSFEINNVIYEYDITSHPKISSCEIRFLNKKFLSYGRTGDVKSYKAIKVFGCILYITDRVLELLKEKNRLPKHLFFTCEDKSRESLYNRIFNANAITKLMNKFGYNRDDEYAKTIASYIYFNSDINKSQYKNYKVYCFTLK